MKKAKIILTIMLSLIILLISIIPSSAESVEENNNVLHLDSIYNDSLEFSGSGFESKEIKKEYYFTPVMSGYYDFSVVLVSGELKPYFSVTEENTSTYYAPSSTDNPQTKFLKANKRYILNVSRTLDSKYNLINYNILVKRKDENISLEETHNYNFINNYELTSKQYYSFEIEESGFYNIYIDSNKRLDTKLVDDNESEISEIKETFLNTGRTYYLSISPSANNSFDNKQYPFEIRIERLDKKELSEKPYDDEFSGSEKRFYHFSADSSSKFTISLDYDECSPYASLYIYDDYRIIDSYNSAKEVSETFEKGHIYYFILKSSYSNDEQIKYKICIQKTSETNSTNPQIFSEPASTANVAPTTSQTSNDYTTLPVIHENINPEKEVFLGSTLDTIYGQKDKYYSFTPNESGVYSITTEANKGDYIEIKVYNDKYIKTDELNYYSNIIFLQSKKTYYLELSSFWTCNFQLLISKLDSKINKDENKRINKKKDDLLKEDFYYCFVPDTTHKFNFIFDLKNDIDLEVYDKEFKSIKSVANTYNYDYKIKHFTLLLEQNSPYYIKISTKATAVNFKISKSLLSSNVVLGRENKYTIKQEPYLDEGFYYIFDSNATASYRFNLYQNSNKPEISIILYDNNYKRIKQVSINDSDSPTSFVMNLKQNQKYYIRIISNVDCNLKVTKAIDSAKVTLSKSIFTFNGKSQKPNISVMLNGTTLQSNCYKIKYEDSINAGKAKAVVLGQGIYSGTVKKEYIINRLKLNSKNIRQLNKSKPYTGKRIWSKFIIKINGVKLHKDIDYKLYSSNNIKVGRAKIEIRGIGNYIGSVYRKIKITPNFKSKKLSMITEQTKKLKIIGKVKKVKWKTSNNRVATVDKNGYVTTKRVGRCSITAKFGKTKLSCRITVKKRFPKLKAYLDYYYTRGNYFTVHIKNNGDKPLIIHPYAEAIDANYVNYDRKLHTANNKTVTIKPGKSKNINFYVSGSVTWFNYKDFTIKYSFTYVNKKYSKSCYADY